eukprot:12249343-Alexandrium_andersonii.AAC.1
MARQRQDTGRRKRRVGGQRRRQMPGQSRRHRSRQLGGTWPKPCVPEAAKLGMRPACRTCCPNRARFLKGP